MNLITLDFETYYSSEYSLSKMTTEAYIRSPEFKVHGACIKINNGRTAWVTGAKLQQLFDRIDWSNVALLCQNTMFDGAVLGWHYGKYPKRYLDTLGMSRALVGAHSARHGLQYIATLLLGQGKTEGLAQTMGVRNLSPEQERILADYCANDVEKTLGVFKKLAPHLPREEYKSIDWAIRCFTQPKVYLDADMLTEYVERVRQAKRDAVDSIDAPDEIEALRAEILKKEGRSELTEDEIRQAKRTALMSNPRYAALLEERGVVPPTKINKKGEVTFAFAKTDEEHKRLLEHENPEVAALVAARMEVKSTIEETRALRFIDAAGRGPFPIPYNYAGANVTQRFSGADKLNMQNLPRSRYDEAGRYIEGTGILRRAIYAPAGYKFMVADLSQIEARIVLWFGMQSSKSKGKEEEALETLRQGGDLYSWFGSLIYGRQINKKDNPTERQIAKSAVLGLGYGMGPGRFRDYCAQSDIKIDAAMAESIVHVYRNTFTGVKAIWHGLDRALKMVLDGMEPPKLPVVSIERDPLFGAWGFKRPCGLMIKYPNLRIEDDEMLYDNGTTPTKLFGGKLLENISQALAGDFIRTHINEINPVYSVVMSTHDELGALVPDGEEEKAEALARSVMTRDIPYMPGLPMAIEVGFAQRYGEVK